MARRSKGERFQHMISVAIKIIGEEGVDALSHRRLAERANVPLGSTTYWFKSRDDILTQALARFAADESVALEHGFASLRVSTVDDLIDVLAGYIARIEVEDRGRLVAHYALFQEASRNPTLRKALHDWTEQWVTLLAEQLAHAGVKDSQRHARVLMPLLDGLLINHLADPVDDFGEEVLRPALRLVCSGWSASRSD
ncbi:TetR family transcriptional regulator [Nonomuraea deserti]|uniref:TetR family transcriptional regulator n=1 Tax=Nonomuraea deserti TaxID=1848322 RepID=A0A4R4V0J3_9ACTN|nr:TetR family transcriptional regulator [Nonomuraea deserti]